MREIEMWKVSVELPWNETRPYNKPQASATAKTGITIITRARSHQSNMNQPRTSISNPTHQNIDLLKHRISVILHGGNLKVNHKLTLLITVHSEPRERLSSCSSSPVAVNHWMMILL
jgi:hypothetical protein